MWRNSNFDLNARVPLSFASLTLIAVVLVDSSAATRYNTNHLSYQERHTTCTTRVSRDSDSFLQYLP